MFSTLIIALFLIELLVLCVLVHTEHEIWGLFSLIVAIAIFKVIGGSATIAQVWLSITDDPLRTGLLVLAYLVAGVLWSFFKYYSYVRKRKREGAKKEDLAREDNTGRAIGWMAYWPISIIAYVIGDGLSRLFIWMYDQVAGIYPRILNAVFKA